MAGGKSSKRGASRALACLALATCVILVPWGFVGGASPRLRTSRMAMRIGHGYQERMSARMHDPGFTGEGSKGAKAFTAADASGATAEVTYKKRPFGIIRYAPGVGMKDAMVMEIIPKSRYPGDPQGQAFAAGVQPGWVVKSVNGQDMTGKDFAAIMDILDDEVMDQRMSQHFYASQKEPRSAEPADAPMTIVYQDGAGKDIQWPEMVEDPWEGFTR